MKILPSSPFLKACFYQEGLQEIISPVWRAVFSWASYRTEEGPGDTQETPKLPGDGIHLRRSRQTPVLWVGRIPTYLLGSQGWGLRSGVLHVHDMSRVNEFVL